jgi:hypothetical protein
MTVFSNNFLISRFLLFSRFRPPNKNGLREAGREAIGRSCPESLAACTAPVFDLAGVDDAGMGWGTQWLVSKPIVLVSYQNQNNTAVLAAFTDVKVCFKKTCFSTVFPRKVTLSRKIFSRK